MLLSISIRARSNEFAFGVSLRHLCNLRSEKDLDPLLLCNLRAFLPGLGHDPGQLAHADGIEGVILVEGSERHAVQLQSVTRKRTRKDLPYLFCLGRAVLIQLIHRHHGGNRPQRVDPLFPSNRALNSPR